MAHGDLPVPAAERSLVLCFASPVARELADLAPRLGWRVALLDPDPARTPRSAAARVADLALDDGTDVVVCDHDRPELGDVLVDVLARPTRWVGVMGSLRHTAPHVAALRERGVPDDDIARVHRPIGLDVGARSPAEIAVATLAGLLADRNGRPGGLFRPS
ncbi:MAG: XdhC family protein [Actinomycetota bacterium]|nr:XdhC family protein [Actinomycetota bacterium]